MRKSAKLKNSQYTKKNYKFIKECLTKKIDFPYDLIVEQPAYNTVTDTLWGLDETV